MQVYAINFHGEQTRDGYWTAGVFSDQVKADRVCTWLNEIMKLNHELWRAETDSWDSNVGGPTKPRPEIIEKMCDLVGQEGYYEVVAEEVFDTAAGWMDWHSQKNPQGMADWPDVADVEAALAHHDPQHALAEEARQLRLF